MTALSLTFSLSSPPTPHALARERKSFCLFTYLFMQIPSGHRGIIEGSEDNSSLEKYRASNNMITAFSTSSADTAIGTDTDRYRHYAHSHFFVFILFSPSNALERPLEQHHRHNNLAFHIFEPLTKLSCTTMKCCSHFCVCTHPLCNTTSMGSLR